MRSSLCLKVVLVLFAHTACVESPTAADHDNRLAPPLRKSIAPTLQGHAVSDGVTEIHIDTLTGEIRIQDAGGGNVVYLEYDDSLLTELVNFVDYTKLGDANYDAMAVLHPWENSGGEPERAGRGSGDDSTTGEKRHYPVQIRPISKVEIEMQLSTSFESLGEWSPDCPSIAEAIGLHRLNYHQRRGSAFDQLRGVQGIPASRLVWRNGKPYITLQDLRNIYIALGSHLAESLFSSFTLDFMRVQYNSYNCQQAIVVQAPHAGSVTVPSSNGNSGGSGGGGAGMSCNRVTLLYEISYDGGMTWYPFTVDTYVCVQMQ